jgi:hypothetical protein
MTIAALAMVEAVEDASILVSKNVRDSGIVHTHGNDIGCYIISEREVAGDGNQNVYETGGTYATDNHSCGSEVGVVVDLVQYREHLWKLAWALFA